MSTTLSNVRHIILEPTMRGVEVYFPKPNSQSSTLTSNYSLDELEHQQPFTDDFAIIQCLTTMQDQL